MTQSAYFVSTGRVPTPVYQLDSLHATAAIPGPAILIDHISTIVVEPGCTAHITHDHNVRIVVGKSGGCRMMCRTLPT
jgi:5-oxoprolinase (ATP-hydrolysing)